MKKGTSSSQDVVLEGAAAAATAATATATATATADISSNNLDTGSLWDDSIHNAQSMYESGGDAASALEILKDAKKQAPAATTAPAAVSITLDKTHNLALLSYLSSVRTTSTNNEDTSDNTKNDPSTLFQTQLEEMYSKELENETKLHSISDTDGTKSIDNNQQHHEEVDQAILRKLILGHNLGLNYLITNRPDSGVDILFQIFKSFSMIDGNNQEANDGSNNNRKYCSREGKDEIDSSYFKFGEVKCKIAFLLLDCILATNQVNSLKPVLQWIAKYIKWSSNNTIKIENHEDAFKISLLKFRLHCYKSKCLFLESKHDEIAVREANTRVAKKELKSAMEIFNHKLAKTVWTRNNSKSGGNGATDGNRGGEGEGEGGESTLVDEGASIEESIALSIGSMSHDPLQDNNNHNQSAETVASSTQNNCTNGTTSASYTGVSTVTEYRTQFETKRLHRQNQSALYLKANLEYLKGNTKKSLKLCSEAQNCGIRQRDSATVTAFTATTANDQNCNEESQWSSDVQYAHHFNNLAIIHQVAGKLHLAMHYYSISLGHIERIEQKKDSMFVEEDGIASPLPLSQILFNASICAQQLSNFTTAHECMSRCVASSPSLFGKDPFCWYHMGESCIYSHVTLKRKNMKNESASRQSETLVNNESLLHRAVDCLNQCIIFCSTNEDNTKQNHIKDLLESSRVLLAYVWLELNEPTQVISLATVTLKADPLPSRIGTGNCVFSLRRRAIMKIYACEANSILGLLDTNADNAVMNNRDSMATHLLAIDLTKQERQKVDDDVKRLHNATAALQISSAISKLTLGDVDNALELTQYVCRNLVNQKGASNDLKYDALSSLIQSLVCSGRVVEAAQFAKGLK